MNKEKLLADFEAASLIALNKFYKENPDATQKEFLAFINDDLPIWGQSNFQPLQRPWCRAFKVHPFFGKTTTMTGALIFVFCFQPTGSATQMRA